MSDLPDVLGAAASIGQPDWGLLIRNMTGHAVLLMDAHGVVTSWNTGAERLFGLAPAAALGRHYSALFDAADTADGRPERDLAIAVADGSLHDEMWLCRSDGERFWANTDLIALRGDDARLVGFGMICRDITDRHRGDELLRESEERFRLLVNSVADYAIFLLDDSGYVSSWNLGAERLKGYAADEILGRHFGIFYTHDDARDEVPARLLRRALAEGRVESEGWRVRRDGTQFWASVVITALRSPDGVSRGFAKVTKDLTDRKRNEDALRGVLERERDAAARLRQLDRMRSEVVGMIAHDLRAPLNVVQNLVHVARHDWPALDDASRLNRMERIGARLDGMAALVDDLFDFVRIEAGQIQIEQRRFDLSELIRTAIADGVPPQESGRIKAHVGDGIEALGDPRRTWQVIINLLSNALKFSPSHAPITIDVERGTDVVTVGVTDEGQGIPVEQHDALFQRFSRLHSTSGPSGAGLGLFVARSMIELQGGTITVRSRPGEGSTFRFTLPAQP